MAGSMSADSLRSAATARAEPPLLRNLVYDASGMLLAVSIMNIDVCTCFCETHTDLPTNTARTARHKGGLAGEIDRYHLAIPTRRGRPSGHLAPNPHA